MCPQPWGSSPYRMNYACIESSFAWPAFSLFSHTTLPGRRNGCDRTCLPLTSKRRTEVGGG